jgi:hypothetical protein
MNRNRSRADRLDYLIRFANARVASVALALTTTYTAAEFHVYTMATRRVAQLMIAYALAK